MKRIIIATGAALLAAIPAAIGLVGNTSFAQSVPVRVPSQAKVVDDNGGLRAPGATEPGDDNGGLTTHVEPGDDNGGLTTHVEPVDDNGGLTTHVEPGDDKVSDSGSAMDDNGVHGGTDTSRTGASGTGGKDDGSGHS